MTKLDAGLITSLPASDPGSAAVWGSKRINPRPQSCLCLARSGCPSNDDDDDQFLLQTAYQLGIPSSLLKWIRIFLSNLTSKINLNGYLSNSIPVKRGIRQGCPLSMLLFIIAIEPLTRKILASANFKGISLGKTP